MRFHIRRLALLAGGWVLHREIKEVAAEIGISGSAASRLLRDAGELWGEAVQLADGVRGPDLADPQVSLC